MCCICISLSRKLATDAVQLVELGWGVIANLKFKTRTDLSDLRQQHPQVAKEFEQLRDWLDSSGSQSFASAGYILGMVTLAFPARLSMPTDSPTANI